MPQTEEPSALLAAMRARFQAFYLDQARFREDAELVEALGREAEPVLEVMLDAFAGGEPPVLHEAYALLTLLARHAASIGATPGVALTIAEAVIAAMRETEHPVPNDRQSELALVAVEGYCAARDERSTRLLRESSADRQVAVELAPGCVGIFLAGTHNEEDLTPTLERFARDLFRGDTQSCLLDVSRLSFIDEELARALGRFCAQAATLGVCSFVTGASAILRGQFERWSVSGGPTMLVDDFAEARSLALAAAGWELRPTRRWSRWFFPTRRALVR